jgi:N-acetylglucosaminyldiphosphoundecaprenol N-acetyl-beta-D-mannosaminyltransferase
LHSYDLDGIKIISSDLTELRSYFLNTLVNSGKPKIIVTFNLEYYRNAIINKDFYSVCLNADMVLPDGVSITSLIKLKHKKGVLRITGNDLFKLILSMTNEIPLKIAFVGSTEQVIEELKNKIRIEYPDCKIAAAISPSYYFENKEEENNKVLQQLVDSKPDVLFLALRNPRTEFWLDKYKDQIGSKLNIGIGAVFDFYTGHKKRSPEIFQKLALEWAWRLFQEPQRLYKRYLIQGIPFYIKKTLQIILKNDNKT